LLDEAALVLILVAIGAQEFPVAAVGRVVVVVVVTVMDLQQLQVDVTKLAAATAAYPRVNPQCTLAVTLGALFARAPRLGDDTVESGVVGAGLEPGHRYLHLAALDGDDRSGSAGRSGQVSDSSSLLCRGFYLWCMRMHRPDLLQSQFKMHWSSQKAA